MGVAFAQLTSTEFGLENKRPFSDISIAHAETAAKAHEVAAPRCNDDGHRPKLTGLVSWHEDDGFISKSL